MITIRPMTRSDVETALEWGRREGWNPGLGDAEPFLAADPGGFFLAEDDGIAVGTISAVIYDKSFGFIGLFIVSPEHRRGRAGIQLIHAAKAYLGKRNVGLDGVVERQEDYARLGFETVCRNARYCGQFPAGTLTPSPEVIELSSLPFAEIAAYDRRHFPAPRDSFLRLWIKQRGGRALGLVTDGRLCGYGVIRQCHVGYKIGPLFADTPLDAERLFRSLASHAGGADVFLDVPGLNPKATELARRYKMQPVFETARMYSHGKPNLEDDHIFGVTTFELG